MKFNRSINIAGTIVSDVSDVFIIAEAGVNHNGDMDRAKVLIDLAAEAGANAVKFQTFKAEHLILKDVKKAPYQLTTTDIKESQFDMLRRLEVSQKQNIDLQKYCVRKKIIFLTTPFDEYSLAQLDDLDLPAYKIASTDITNLLFLKKTARKKKPIILSTGMADLADVTSALEAIYPINKDVVLLQCTANYPIKDEEAHLRVITTFAKNFDMLIGYSDHTVGVGAGPYAVALGAKMIEKHFTLDKSLEGPDHRASLDPAELKIFVREIRKARRYLGSEIKNLTASEVNTRRSLQKCLVAARAIRKGELFTEENIVGKRTGGVGISCIAYATVVGKKANQDFQKDDILEVN